MTATLRAVGISVHPGRCADALTADPPGQTRSCRPGRPGKDHDSQSYAGLFVTREPVGRVSSVT